MTLALTAGEKGAPAGADVAEYRKSKIAEAEAFAAELGGEAIVLGYPDGCCRITTRRASPCAMSSAA